MTRPVYQYQSVTQLINLLMVVHTVHTMHTISKHFRRNLTNIYIYDVSWYMLTHMTSNHPIWCVHNTAQPVLQWLFFRSSTQKGIWITHQATRQQGYQSGIGFSGQLLTSQIESTLIGTRRYSIGYDHLILFWLNVNHIKQVKTVYYIIRPIINPKPLSFWNMTHEQMCSVFINVWHWCRHWVNYLSDWQGFAANLHLRLDVCDSLTRSCEAQ